MRLVTVEILLSRLRRPRGASGWRPMRFAALSLVLLAGCAVPTEGEEYAKLFGDLSNDGLGGGPITVVMTWPTCPEPGPGERFCTASEAKSGECAYGCVADPSVGMATCCPPP